MSFRWILFILAEHTLFVIKFYLAEIIPDSPEYVDIQLQRQELYYGKVVEGKGDDVDDIDEVEASGTNLIIADTDLDWNLNKDDDGKEEGGESKEDPDDIKYEVN